MLNLINQIVVRAKANRQRIVLPEGTEERTLKAANMHSCCVNFVKRRG